jgi:hypothetical protein
LQIATENLKLLQESILIVHLFQLMKKMKRVLKVKKALKAKKVLVLIG